jgi:endoglucanase
MVIMISHQVKLLLLSMICVWINISCALANGDIISTTIELPFAKDTIIDGRIQNNFTLESGAIIRGDSSKKNLSLVFTGDEYFEGLNFIIKTLDQENIKGSFFFTGRLYRNPEVSSMIKELYAKGHYLGAHSDMHILYNDWIKRDSMLVTKDSLLKDLEENFKVMQSQGIDHPKKFYIPPYEWWNREIAGYINDLGIELLSFTPGTRTNADYTWPGMGAAYKSSDQLMEAVKIFEQTKGLNGIILLIHIGTDPRRTDKFFNSLPELIRFCRQKGYEFFSISELLHY